MKTAPTIVCPTPQLPAGAQGIARVAVDDERALLTVTFERPIPAAQTYLSDPRSYSLTGGQRLFPRILSAAFETPLPGATRVLLQLDQAGDFSVYTLTVSGPDIDPFFASHKLRFRLACDDAFDCRPPAPTPPATPELPVLIDYLIKDYASFRQALLDFIPTRLPAWTERSEADIGLMLLELLAATADSLSYMQDRVANEAFLDTATQRRSVAAHLALIGYAMDPGAAAYTWLQLQVNSAQSLTASSPLQVSNLRLRADEPLIIFETLGAARFFPEHNSMTLYNWGNKDCCLPATALSATLAGSFPNLRTGDYLLFADGTRRDVVRLVAPPDVTSGPGSPPTLITIVRWSAATKLRYDYCAPETIVRGNLVPATHGETVGGEDARSFTPDQIAALKASIKARRPGQHPPRQRVQLARAPLAYLDASTLALAAPPGATPDNGILSRAPVSTSTLSVRVEGFTRPWQERATLLASGGQDQVFRVELDDVGDATVVFGDDVFGRRPEETAQVTATYRVGGGAIGNVGADTLIVARTLQPWLDSVTNPLPAVGGRNRESSEHAKRFGPPSFHKPLVAVTAADYQNAAQSLLDASGQRPIQRSSAMFAWTGSWLTVTLAVDPANGTTFDATLRRSLLDFLDTRRLAGYDLQLIDPVFVALELALEFCASAGFVPADVEQRLLDAFSTRHFFHADNFTFGDSVFTSRIYAAAMNVAGVESVDITRLARSHAARPDRDTAANLKQGFLAVGRNQIVRLDNDRNFPQNGTMSIRTIGAHS